jgi:dTDP-4-dehydrorhamnose reductase
MIELWGGHECTVNRVGDRYFDQTVRSGHETRLSDLELFSQVGVKALRYPVLWERVRPDGGAPDWRWSDERLGELRRLNIRPIVGPIHHGSGPIGTDLLDDGFAPGLAAHAAEAARRYPWVEQWTPVNEPLTTARFSCLYGAWYPHTREEGAFWRALLNQIDAVRLSMREIRRVNSRAQLVQTDDLGFCHSVPVLARQAEYENERRWLTWDLLSGRVTRDHPLWERLDRHGLGDRLRAVADDPCPSDVIGANHYLTSERFIDDRIELYPEDVRGGDGDQCYMVNVGAVSFARERMLGLEALLTQAWDRYRVPVAVTECHNGCSRDEQMRWFVEVWRAAEAARARGADVRAVTAWALLGSYDWHRLVTVDDGHYECGVFDVRGGSPRWTGMASTLKALSEGREPDSFALAAEGWWRRGPPAQPERGPPARPATGRGPRKYGPLLITGRTGTLGQAVARACSHRGLAHVLTSRAELKLDDPASIRDALKRLQPCAVVNAAGWVRVDEAETDVEACLAANALGPELLARECERLGVPLVAFSSDLVFGGDKGEPYVESDTPAPLNVYGRSKAEAERRVLGATDRALIVRTAAFFGPHDVHNFAVQTLAALRRGKRVRAAGDAFVSPTYVPDLVEAMLDLLIDGETGVWHLANQGRVSWAEFAAVLAERTGRAAPAVEAVPSASLGWRAERPRDSTLGSERACLLPDLFSAVDRFLDARPGVEALLQEAAE